jgi:hypothetical protein
VYVNKRLIFYQLFREEEMEKQFLGVWNLGGQLMNCIQSALGMKQKRTETDSTQNSTKLDTKESDMVPDNFDNDDEIVRGLIERKKEPPTPRSRSIEPEVDKNDNSRGLIERKEEPPTPRSRSMEPEVNKDDMVSFDFNNGNIEVRNQLHSRGLIQRRKEPISPRPPRRK